MKSFIKEVKSLMKNLKFTVPLILSVLIGYGFTLTHFSIGIDDLTRPRYVFGEMLAQGRLSGTLINFLFGCTEYRPYYEEALSIIFILIAAVTGAIFIKRITENKINPHACTFFACFIATYPIINEIFLYAGSGLNMAIGYMLTFIAILLMNSFFDNKKISRIIWATVIMIFNISLYESFIFVYICCVCATLFIKQLIADGTFPQATSHGEDKKDDEKVISKDNSRSFKNVSIEAIWYIVPLAVGLILEYLISNGVRIIANISASDASASDIVFPPNLYETAVSITINYILDALWYLPITLLVISGIILLVITIKQSLKNKKHIYWLYTAGIALSILALPILQSGSIKYRNAQSLVVFCMFPLVLLLQKLLCNKKILIRAIALSMAGILILLQSLCLLKWFYVDYLQSKEEKAVMLKVAKDLEENYDITKPVVFAGKYSLTDDVLDYKYARKDSVRYKALDSFFGMLGHNLTIEVPSENYGFPVAQTHHGSVISWGCYAFDEANTELLRIYKYYGYDFIQGTMTQVLYEYESYLNLISQDKAERSAYNIIDRGDYIAVIFL